MSGTRKSTTKGQHSFAVTPRAEIQRSSLDRNCGHKTTFNAAELVPIFIDEALPGDTMSMKMSLFARITTLLFPIMDNVWLDTHWFFIPNRLIWDNWEKFNGAQDNPGDSTDFLVPQLTNPAGGFEEHSLSDYFGIPTKVDPTKVTSLFHRAYNLTINDWFRDENLQDSLVVDKGDGPDDAANYTNLFKRGKRHDYFTSALPWPQKGDAVELPLGLTAPVNPIDRDNLFPTWQWDDASGAGPFTNQLMSIDNTSDPTHNLGIPPATQIGSGHTLGWWNPQLEADLSSATSATINDLREAFQIQRLYERDARGGTRYTEILKSHFGVTSPDSRLQRVEYLGGGTTPLMLTPVARTAAEDAAIESNVAELAAYGVASSSNQGFTKSFTEHGIILGLVSSRADINYQQGINRMFTRSTRFDYYWPVFSHLGEQTILNKELFADGSSADEEVFGYQERYAEYRYKPSIISGQMRSNSTLPLDAWHLAQDFAALPTLSDQFIQEDPPMERIEAVPTEPDFTFDSYFQYRCVRPMPMYGVPGMIDHF